MAILKVDNWRRSPRSIPRHNVTRLKRSKPPERFDLKDLFINSLNTVVRFAHDIAPIFVMYPIGLYPKVNENW